MEEITEVSSVESPMSLSSLITALTTMRDQMGAPGSAGVYIMYHDAGPRDLLEQVEYTRTEDGDDIIVLHGLG